jgi:hypothetical protein
MPPIVTLGSFVVPVASGGGAASAGLLRSPRVVPGSDSQTVLVGFADAASHQMVTLRIEVLPAELSALADELERFLREDVAAACAAEPTSLAERARAHLVVIGTRFSSFARGFIADAVRDWMAASAGGACTDGGVRGLRERARAHLVVIGRRALREVIVTAEGVAPNTHLLTIPSSLRNQRHDLSVAMVRATTVPPALGSGAARIHVAGSGRNLLVSWEGANRLFYQEYDGTSWLPEQSLLLTPTFTLLDAYAVLDGRAR